MIDSTLSERGWAWTGKLVEKSVSCLASVYFSEMRMVNEEDHESEGEAHLTDLVGSNDYQITNIITICGGASCIGPRSLSQIGELHR